MTKDAEIVHDAVREHYAAQAKASSCCGPSSNSDSSCCAPSSSTDSSSKLYPLDMLTELPEDVTNFSLGCGDPITLAGLQPGQTVLDLGSGGGLDCFLAARRVGPNGHVIGVDMTPEMLERARSAASRLKIDNVEFRQGFLEDLPVEAGTVDVAISNCVINLAPDKAKVLEQVFRVLKPGGKMAVSDIVTDGPLPAEVKNSLSAWAGCIAGALDIHDYEAALKKAGFVDITITPTYFDEETVAQAMREMDPNGQLKGITPEAAVKTVFSARIVAFKH